MTPFSPAGYVDLIAGLRGRGYRVSGYRDAEPAQRHLILRHDVDMSLALAAEMAALEASIGVAATYFVLIRSEFYNAMTPDSGLHLQAIRAHGHAVGLHFDAALYAEAAALEAAAARECALLESAAGAPVEVVSFHRPAPGLVGAADRIAGRINAYGPRYVGDIGYCSDSRGAWHRGDPFAHAAVAAGRALQLLTHPIWWMGEPALPEERLHRFLAARAAFLDRELARHSTVHQPRT